MSIEFTVNRDRNGEITGFSLLGSGEDQDIAFCLSFMRAWELDQAHVAINNRRIVFTHLGVEAEFADSRWGTLGVHPGATHSVTVTLEEDEALVELLAASYFGRKKAIVRPEFTKTGRGFTFYGEPKE